MKLVTFDLEDEVWLWLNEEVARRKMSVEKRMDRFVREMYWPESLPLEELSPDKS